VWRGLGHYNPDTEGYRQKVFWWREGYDINTEPEPKLVVTGRLLDGNESSSFAFSDATNAYNPDIGSAMLTGIDIPNYGCWEITGHYKGQSLSFVVSVEP
jgi:hypothetical protein